MSGIHNNIKEQCRICENDGVYNIEQEYFKSSSSSNNENYFSLSLAFSKFSSLWSAQQPVFRSQLPQLLCTLCTEQLVLSYEFLLKVTQSDEKYAEHFAKTENEIVIGNEDEIEIVKHDLEEDCFYDIIDIVDSAPSSIEKDYERSCDDDVDDNNYVEESFKVSTEIDPLIVSRKDNLVVIDDVNDQIQLIPKPNTTIYKLPRNTRKRLDFSESILHSSNQLPIFLPQYKLSNQLPDDIAAQITKRIKTKKCASSNDEDSVDEHQHEDDDDDERQHQQQQRNRQYRHKNAININTMRTIDVTAVQMRPNEILFDSADVFKKNVSHSSINSDAITTTTTTSESSTFVCKYCPKAYSSAHYLIKHTRKSHLCQYCLETFVIVKDLYQHIRVAHNSFTCSICNNIFAKNSNLRNHVRKIHNINLPANVSFVPEEADEEMARKIALQIEN